METAQSMETRQGAVLKSGRLVLLLGSLMLVASTGWAGLFSDSLIEPFLGAYRGHVEFEENGQVIKRDLGVKISETDDGFNVFWKSTTLKPSGKTKTKDYSIDFTETDREHVFAAAQKKDLFGHREQLDPMKGEPYVWARIVEDTLTVYALLINDDGGYELQIYDRTLGDNILTLRYSRIRNNEQLRVIESKLTKGDFKVEPDK